MRSAHWMMLVLLMSCARNGAAEEPRATERATSTAPAPAPSPAALLFQESYDSEAGNKLDAALAVLDRLPEGVKGSYVAELRRGWLHYRLGHNSEAILAYARAVALEPASIEARVGALAPQAALRRWADVETTARDILRTDPGNYSAAIRLAFALFSSGRFADAEATYRGLLARYPSDVDVQDGVGWSLLRMGRTDDARKVFTQVLAIAPKNALAQDGIRAMPGKT